MAAASYTFPLNNYKNLKMLLLLLLSLKSALAADCTSSQILLTDKCVDCKALFGSC